YDIIEIEDSAQNRIGQWLNETSNGKILQLSYSLNSEAREGSYQVIVSIGEVKLYHSFKVEKYVMLERHSPIAFDSAPGPVGGVGHYPAPPPPVVTVRSFFPETWIWDLIEVGLTAFVLRSFAKAQSFIYIDPEKIAESKTWLESKQQENGCFLQLGKLFNNRMKGGVSDEVTLSAYITAAFLEMNVS
ncbi:Alpha-1-macroglobulin, partial [Larimichthys crocea]